MSPVRPARSTDTAALAHLAGLQSAPAAGHARIVDPAAYVGYLLTAQAEAGAMLFVATARETVVGHVLVGRPVTIDGEPGACAFLSDLYVHPEHRRHGLGSALTRSAEAHARAVGAVRIALKVLAGNYDAVDFYRQQGYDDEFLVMARTL